VNEIVDVSYACGSVFGVRLMAVGRSVTHLPVGLDAAAEFVQVALQGPLGGGAGAVDAGLHTIEVFRWGCRIVSGRFNS
jgi:hypothetical protein